MAVYLLSAGAFWLAAVVRQALSWRRSDVERRQQLKWLASGAAVCGVLGISAVSTNSSIWEVLILGFAALPLSIGIGILKYRLYEIDRLISRTLAYAIVTGLLVGVYAGLVLLSTHVFTVHGMVAVASSSWPPRPCSPRYAGGSSTPWTGASTGPATTPTRPSPPSPPTSRTPSTSTPSAPTSPPSSTAPWNPPTSPSG